MRFSQRPQKTRTEETDRYISTNVDPADAVADVATVSGKGKVSESTPDTQSLPPGSFKLDFSA